LLVAVALSATAVATPATASTLTNGLRLVDRYYLFASELDAGRLLGAALEYTEALIPEVTAQPAGGRAYLLTAGACRLRLEPAPDATVPDLAPLLRQAAALIDRCVVDPPANLPSPESLLLAGVLDGLDPYSTVFDNERKTEHTIQFRGKLAGIGARIGIRDEHLELVTVYPDAPAHAAGLRDGDVVRRIDGVSTTNMSVSDAVRRIRGDVGTEVRLDVERKSASGVLPITVVRALVTIPSVTARLLASGVVYSEISHFSQTTPDDFRRRVAELVVSSNVTGVIIDLRSNSGGSMLGSSAIADLFLDHGLLITTSGRRGMNVSGLTSKIEASSEAPFSNLPVAVLTSPRTASGSELLAASLRNNDRAILLGERTFGKGTVQKTYSLGSDASLKLTVGHFLPNGQAIPGGGLEPNVEIQRVDFSKSGVLLPRHHDAGTLPFWLRTPEWLDAGNPWKPTVIAYARDLPSDDEGDHVETADHAENDEAEPASDAPTVKTIDDPLVDLAAEILSRFGSTSATGMLIAARPFLEAHAERADRDLQSVMQAKGLDWRPAGPLATIAGPVEPSFDVSVRPEGGSLQPGERSKLAVTLRNTGKRPVYRLRGTLSSDSRFLNGRGLLFGYLEPGAIRTWEVEVDTPRGLHAGRLAVALDLRDDHGSIESTDPVILAVGEGTQPLLAHRVAISEEDEPANATSSSPTGKLLTINLEIANRGDAAAEDVKVFLRHPESDDFEPVDGIATVERLEPNEHRTVRLSVRLLTSNALPPQADVVLSEPAFGLFYDTSVPLVATAGFGRWREAPIISVRTVCVSKNDDYGLVAEVTDDSALQSLWTRLDGQKLDYIAPHAARLEIDLPWKPDDGVKQLEIVATDDDGLTTRYVTDL
jgi:carboxyl-terminal processing protease